MPGDVSQKLGREANQWQVHHGTITRRACIVAVRFEAPALGGRQHAPISRPSPCSLDAGDPDHSTGVHAERSGAAPSVSVGASGSIPTDSELGDEGGIYVTQFFLRNSSVDVLTSRANSAAALSPCILRAVPEALSNVVSKWSKRACYVVLRGPP